MEGGARHHPPLMLSWILPVAPHNICLRAARMGQHVAHHQCVVVASWQRGGHSQGCCGAGM